MSIRKSIRSALTPDSRAFVTAFSRVATPRLRCRPPGLGTLRACGAARRRGIPSEPRSLGSGGPLLARIEINAIRMVEHQGAHAGFRVHHHAIGQSHTNFFGL